ncbi:MAG: hypothetical protein AMXMBFR47_26370 [Planctomycetota bacterium]
MSKGRARNIAYSPLELEIGRFAVLRESVLLELCRRAGVEPACAAPQPAVAADSLDSPGLADRLVQRRRAAGVGQAELARRAGVRVETLNRIERGRTTPDFSTIRKLVVALGECERRQADNALRGRRS